MRFDMKELKIGERVTITLEVVEHNSCEGCFFTQAGCHPCAREYKCSKFVRLDGKSIIFKEVKE